MTIYLLITGLFVGSVSGLFGVGGGIILMPILLILGFNIKVAVGISIMQMVFSSLFGTFLNYKNNTLDLKGSSYLGIGGIFGGIFGVYMLSIIPSYILEVSLFCIIILSIAQALKPKKTIPNNQKQLTKTHYLLVGIVASALCIPLGIGGAIVIIALFNFLNLEAKKTSSMSLFFVLFTSISSAIALSYHSLILGSDTLIMDFESAIIVALASVIGVYLGIKIKNNLNESKYKRLFLPLFFISLFLMIYKIYTTYFIDL